MKERNWQSYLYELITIILGISISFLANECRVNYGNTIQEQRILSDIHENLLTDSTLINEEVKALQFVDYVCSRVLRLDNIDALPQDSIDLFFRCTQLYSTLPVNDIAYQAMEQTGEFALISNRTLLKKIIGLYDIHYFNINEYNEVDKNLILDRVIPYYEANFPHGEDFDSEKANAVIQELHFRNLIKNNQHFKRIQIRLYQEQQKLIRELIREIELELS